MIELLVCHRRARLVADRRRPGPVFMVAVLAWVVLMALGGCSIPGSAVEDGEGILGTYTVNGVDNEDFEYSGTVTISATDLDGVYSMQWLITGAIHEGTAELVGDRLEVTWKSLSNPRGEIVGTASYALDAEGNFTGTKVMNGVTGEATETIFQKA